MGVDFDLPGTEREASNGRDDSDMKLRTHRRIVRDQTETSSSDTENGEESELRDAASKVLALVDEYDEQMIQAAGGDFNLKFQAQPSKADEEKRDTLKRFCDKYPGVFILLGAVFIFVGMFYWLSIDLTYADCKETYGPNVIFEMHGLTKYRCYLPDHPPFRRQLDFWFNTEMFDKIKLFNTDMFF